MLYVVIHIHRSGSTNAALNISEQLNAQYMGEVMYAYRQSGILEYISRVEEIIKLSLDTDILVKFHISDLERIQRYSNELFESILTSATKLYYPIRLDYKAQIISQMIADITNQWSRNRDTNTTMVLKESDIPKYLINLKHSLSTQGTWFKQFPGELIILEQQPYNSYPKYNFRFTGLKTFLNRNTTYHDLFQPMDVLEVFNQGCVL